MFIFRLMFILILLLFNEILFKIDKDILLNNFIYILLNLTLKLLYVYYLIIIYLILLLIKLKFIFNSTFNVFITSLYYIKVKALN